MQILIIKVGAIGDVIRTTALLPGLKDKYPQSSISWLTKKASSEVLENNPYLKQIYRLEQDQEKVLKEKYELVINLDDDFSICQVVTKIKTEKLMGAYESQGKCLYTEEVAPWFDMGLISRFGKEKADQLKMLNRKTYQQIAYEMLGLTYKHQEPVIMLKEKDKEFAEKFKQRNNIAHQDKVIGINTGAGGRWQDKKLSEEKTAEIINLLNQQTNLKIILFGGAEERERNKRIMAQVKTPIIDAGCNNSLMEFAALINLCDVLITSDSMALHLATACKKKVIVFFCPTSPWEIELYDRGEKIIPLEGCVCCYKTKCDVKPDYNVQEIIQKTLAQTTK